MDSYEYKVLIVDDEDDVRNGWVAGLCALGVRRREFFAIGARTAGDALDLLSEEKARGAPFNVAVLDLHLEGSGEPYESDRWALARQLKELYQPYPDLGIIVVTAIHHDPADFKAASDIADPVLRLAPSGHGTHGRRPGKLRRQSLGSQPRRAQPVHRGRQRFRNLGRRQSHDDDPGCGALHRRLDEEESGQLVRLTTRRIFNSVG